jgi:hypothetical protein
MLEVTHFCFCGCLFVSNIKTGFSFPLLTSDIHFTKHVPSYSLVGVSSLRLGILDYFSFIPIHPYKPTTTQKTHKQFQENVYGVMLCWKRFNVTKYRNIDMAVMDIF